MIDMKATFTDDQLAELISVQSFDDLAAGYPGLTGDAAEDLPALWITAVMQAVQKVLGRGKLRAKEVGIKSRSVPTRHGTRIVWGHKIEPKTSWKHSAEAIRQIINDDGFFYYESLQEFLAAGPFNPRQAVLSHLHWLVEAHKVYGYASPKKIYKRELDAQLREYFGG